MEKNYQGKKSILIKKKEYEHRHEAEKDGVLEGQ